MWLEALGNEYHLWQPSCKELTLMCLGAKNDCYTAGRLPFKCFLKFEILALFIHPSIENLLCEKHAENVLMEPHVWSDIVYIRLTQFENNAIWQKRQVDEMSVVSFFISLFFGILVEWVEYNHGKAESWPWFLAVTDILYDSGQETWLQPHTHYRAGSGRREAQGLVQCSSILVFCCFFFFFIIFKIRLEGYPADTIQATCTTASLPSGQAVKRVLFIKTKPWILLMLELHGAAGHGGRREAGRMR